MCRSLIPLLGDNGLYSGEVSLTHDTRDSPIQASRGHYFEFKFEEVFGDFDYARFELEFRTVLVVRPTSRRIGSPDAVVFDTSRIQRRRNADLRKLLCRWLRDHSRLRLPRRQPCRWSQVSKWWSVPVAQYGRVHVPDHR